MNFSSRRGMNFSLLSKAGATLVLSLALLSCGQNEEQPENKAQKNSDNSVVASHLNQNENAIVKVGDQIITQDDLDAAILRTVGELGAFQLDQEGRSKVLESIVLSTIMAQKQMDALSVEEKQQVEIQVKAYRNELLAKKYLKENISSLPVTNEMVKNYYEKHPEKFGGKTIKTYEVIKGLTKLEGDVRKKLLAEINRVGASKNWQGEVEKLKRQGYQITYARAAHTDKSLNKQIDIILAGLELNEVSSVHYLDGMPMIFKVVESRTVEPKPLSQVRTEIRKALAPLQLKKAVRQISDELLKQANIEYIEPAETQ
ncbi:peptidylprolyl isomerase [Aliikangiella coralliicola]|uniref:peptidylprolyl isomerase n=1 Tax=Aliikangiella coralliicola TaxID=2592383 RepID=A0A545UD98_9GAMM|nr:peptidylprolyl isomerase [Aliikangiella coralliicola]TQV87442.1 hypothetical protein FLL46_13445 [Aliikangiella coralliicola]